MTARSGPTEIVTSGTIVAYEGEPIRVPVVGDEESIDLVFVFEDEEGEGSRVDSEVIDATTLELKLVNFANPLGSGSPKPVDVGTLDGDPLHLHFRVRRLEGSDPELTYTVYRVVGEG